MRVLLIVNRGMGAACLNIYGGVWAETPFLDALAAESLVARHHFSETPDTAEISQIWLQGLKAWGKLAPFRLRILDTKVPKAVPSLISGAQELSQTLALKALAKAISKAARDELLIVERTELLWPWPGDILEVADPGPALGEADPEEETGPMEPQLGPVDPMGALARRLQAARAEILTKFDSELELIYNEVDKAWHGTPWALVVTSDTGFPLGEMGWAGPDQERPLSQEVLRIPLIIHSPEVEPGLASRDFTGHRALADWLARARDFHEKGIPEVVGDDHHLSRHSTHSETGEIRWECLRDGDSTLIRRTDSLKEEAETLFWFRQPEDWHEVNDLANREPDACQEASENLDELLSQGASEGADHP